MRGGTDLGFLMKIKDDRVKSGQRVFKVKVYGAEKKANIAGFGEVDMQGNLILLATMYVYSGMCSFSVSCIYRSLVILFIHSTVYYNYGHV